MKTKPHVLCLLGMLLFTPLLQAQDMLAEIRMFGGNFPPRGWAFCEGQLLPINQYQALFSLIGTIYGGDGRTTFALPDLRGRVAIHKGQGNGLSNVHQGEQLGTERNTMLSTQVPSHQHPLYGVLEDGTTSSPQGAYFAGTKALDREYAAGGTTVAMNASVLGTNTTSNEPIDNRQPSLAVSYIICIQGYFPSRN